MITHQLTEKLRFEDHLVSKQNPGGLDAVAKLEHFAIITYAVDPDRFCEIVPERFRLHTVPVGGNRRPCFRSSRSSTPISGSQCFRTSRPGWAR